MGVNVMKNQKPATRRPYSGITTTSISTKRKETICRPDGQIRSRSLWLRTAGIWLSFFGFGLSALAQAPSLDSASPKEREAAVQQLAVLGNREAIPKIAEALKKEPKSDLRATMVAALGRIRDREAVPVLAETLQTDLDKDVRSQAIDSLLRLYIPIEDSGPIRTIFSRVKSVFLAPDAPVVAPGVQVDVGAKEALASAVQTDSNDEVRAEAAQALGSLKARDQVPALVATLENPQNREHRNVRIEIIRSLGTLRDPAAGPALQRALRDPNRQIVEEAITAIGLTGYREAGPALQEMFRTSSNGTIKRRSLEALSLMRDPRSVPLFESLLDHSDDYYRELAAEGLARLDYNANGWEQRLSAEKKDNVRNALAFGLAASGKLAYINTLANALDSRHAYQSEVYLYELGRFEGQLNELYRYLGSPNPKIRAGMARVIGNIGDPASSEQIRSLTDDPNTEVVREAVAALRKLSQ